MKIGFGVSIGIDVLFDGTLMGVFGVEIGGVEEIGVDVEETGRELDDAATLLELGQGVGTGAGFGLTTVAVTSRVTVSPGITTSIVVVVLIVEVGSADVSVESPPTLTTA